MSASSNGKLAHGLDLARPLAVEGVRLETARESKLERTLIVAFALAELLVAGGERVGIPGLMAPTTRPQHHRQDGAGDAA